MKIFKFENFIKEGLIKTYPITTFLKALNKIVDSDYIRLDNIKGISMSYTEVIEDGEYELLDEYDIVDIFKVTLTKELIDIINVYGYFISIAKLSDSYNIIKSGFKEGDKYDYITIEKRYDNVSGYIPNKLYHVSPIRYKSSILKNGLLVKSGSKLSYHPKRVYLMEDYKDVHIISNYIVSLPYNKWFEKGYCVFEVDTSNITNLYTDPNFDKAYYIYDSIRPEHLKLIDEVLL